MNDGLNLERYPEPEVNLRAWNAADTYLLEWINDHRMVGDGACCVVNDSFGALALGLIAAGEPEVVSWSDSFLAHEGARANAARNALDTTNVTWLPSTAQPQAAANDEPFGLVVLRVPKSLDHLDHQLNALAESIGPDTVVVAGGMTKQIHTSTLKKFEKLIGPTTTSLAQKKARLIFVTPEVEPEARPRPPAKTFTTSGGLTLIANPAVFSSTKTDPGSALLLEAVAPLLHHQDLDGGLRDVVDLGCGSGVVGLTLLQSRPDLTITFTDESYLAVNTSQASLEHNLDRGALTSPVEQHRFLVDDCGATIADGSADLVCINPPFHDATAQTHAIAARMFNNAARMLRSGGKIVVVGNRHLNYHTKLRKWFDQADVIASNRRFVVIAATA